MHSRQPLLAAVVRACRLVPMRAVDATWYIALACGVTLLWSSNVLADALVRSDAMRAVTIAEFFVERDAVRVELEIGSRDLPAFRNLLPDALYEELGNPPRAEAERRSEFFARELSIAVPDGPTLEGRLVEIAPRARVRRDEITGEPLPTDPESAEPTIFARLEYRLPDTTADDPPPSQLLLSAPPRSSVGFVLYHAGVAVNDFRYLGRDMGLLLDWSDPFYSRFEAPGLRRQYFDAMSGFLYVEPYEVRKEIIVRPLDLQQWVDLGLEGRATIPIEIQPELKRRAAEVLPRTTGTVIELLVQEGDRVQADQVLAKIDDREAQATLRDAKLALQEAKNAGPRLSLAVREAEEVEKRAKLTHQQANRDYERNKSAGFVSSSDLEKLELTRDQAYRDWQSAILGVDRAKQELENQGAIIDRALLAVEKAELELSHFEIKAPFEGVIAERMVNIGASVGPSAGVFLLTDPDQLRAVLYRPQKELEFFQRAAALQEENQDSLAIMATPEAYNDVTYPGHIRRVSPSWTAKPAPCG